MADETRRARTCQLCAERKAALPPAAVSGHHDSGSALAEPLVEAVHRIATDPARLSRGWLEGLLAAGASVECYVEALGVATQTISIDAFHHALGMPLEPLPTARPGEPSRRRPAGAALEEAWVPMVRPDRLGPDEAGLYGPSGRTGNVIRALSLVPDEVRALQDLSGAQYLTLERMAGHATGRALERSQMELVAGRVSALRECFY